MPTPVWSTKDRRDGRRSGEPWVAVLESVKPLRGVAKPWRITVNRGHYDPYRDGTRRPAPAVFAEFGDEPTARSAFEAAVKYEKTK